MLDNFFVRPSKTNIMRAISLPKAIACTTCREDLTTKPGQPCSLQLCVS
jgi:hypothetical protein